MSLVRDMLNRSNLTGSSQDERFSRQDSRRQTQSARGNKSQYVTVTGGYFLDSLRDVMGIDVVFADLTSKAYDRQDNASFERSLYNAMRNKSTLNANLLIVYERRTGNGKYVRASEMLPCQIRPSEIQTESGKKLNDMRSFTIIRETERPKLYYGYDDVDVDHAKLIFDAEAYRRHTLLTSAIKQAVQHEKSQQLFNNKKSN